jgi:L-alanine-DL-glutamate epimerase-like enolase superfamily enzyme
VAITDLTLYRVPAADDGGDGAADDERSAGGPWASEALVASPMSIYPEYHDRRRSWNDYADGAYVLELTSEGGETGVAPVAGAQFAAAVVDDHFRQFVEGAEPFDRERVWEQCYRAQLPYGQRGVPMMALSAVDLALWDLQGNLTGRPVYDLAGGRTQAEIPCYATTHPDVMEHVADEGFLGVKLAAPWGPTDGYREGLRKTEAVVARARDLFDADAELMLDCYMAWDREFTVRAADRLAAYDLKWLEDPLHPGAVEEYAAVASEVKPVQLAVGNLEFGDKPYHQLMAAGAVDVVQPELQWAGGLTAGRRVAAMAKARGLPAVLHAGSVYAYHYTMATTNAPYAEYFVPGDGTEIGSNLPAGLTGDPLPEDGTVDLGDDPGFGVELDRDAVEPVHG